MISGLAPNSELDSFLADPFSWCVGCKMNLKAISCKECDIDLCIGCSVALHQHESMKSHKRTTVPRSRRPRGVAAALAGLSKTAKASGDAAASNHHRARSVGRTPMTNKKGRGKRGRK